MVNWILPNLGTAAAGSIVDLPDAHFVDVRDLVDKWGNDAATVRSRIDAGLQALKAGRRVVVCCDHGISRSNAVAAGILASYRAVSLESAVREVVARLPGAEIKIDVLQAIRDAVESAVGQVSARSDAGEVVLLTGATGAVGPEIAAALARSTTVICPTRHEVDLAANAVHLDLLAVSANATCIAHFANPRVMASNRSLGESLTMLRNVLEVCRLRSLRLVFPSSWEVFSGYRGALVADVDLPRLPKSVYGETMHLAELLIEHYCRHHRLKACVLRSGPIYAPGIGKPKFLHNFIAKAMRGEDIYTHRYVNGDPGLDIVALADYARCAASAITRRAEGVFHIGSGRVASTPEIAAYVVENVGSSSALKVRAINDTTASIAMDPARARAELCDDVETPWRDGIASVISEVRQNVRNKEKAT